MIFVDIDSQGIYNKPSVSPSQELKDVTTNFYLHEKEVENAVKKTTSEIQKSEDTVEKPTVKVNFDQAALNSTTITASTEDKTSTSKDESTIHFAEQELYGQDLNHDEAAQKRHDCKQLKNRASVSKYWLFQCMIFTELSSRKFQPSPAAAHSYALWSLVDPYLFKSLY